MAMKVYQSGDLVVLEKNAEPAININVNVCSFRIQDNIVAVFNRTDPTIENYDIVENIQDSVGADVGDFDQVLAYLNAFILSGSGASEILPLKGETYNRITMNFEQDATLTSILFMNPIGGDILISFDINTIEAVANGTDIRIQLTGGHKVLVDRLDLESVYIDTVLVTQVLATAIIEINALFVNAGGLVGNLPVITSTNTINLIAGNTINHIITGTNIVALEVDTSTTGTVPAGAIRRPDQDPRRVIGGSTLAIGTYLVYITAYNYFGQVTQTLSIIVSSSFVNTYSAYGGLVTTDKHFLVDSAIVTQPPSPLFRAANSTGNSSDAAYAWSVSFYHKSAQTAGSGRGCPFGVGGTRQNRPWAGFDVFIYGSAAKTEVRINYGGKFSYVYLAFELIGTPMSSWNHYVVCYNGGDTDFTTNPGGQSGSEGCFSVYINGVSIAQTSSFSSANGFSGVINAEDMGSNYTQDTSVRIMRSFYVPTAFPSTKMNIDEMGFFNYTLSGADVTTLYNLGVPISLNGALAVDPLDYVRCGDGVNPLNPANTDLLNFPVMYNFYSGRFNWDAQNMTVADYVSDVP